MTQYEIDRRVENGKALLRSLPETASSVTHQEVIQRQIISSLLDLVSALNHKLERLETSTNWQDPLRKY